ncbi:hypothetical protein FRC09_010152 [Ceratobasidium sp. 395]|nr:hypothetical protein FRC09_010152 [Ceratobasidium sp. 395]
MKFVARFVGLLCFALQAWGIGLSWPGDGGIVSGQTIQISFDGGTAPYTLTVLGFNPRNADNNLQTFSGQAGPNVQWRVSVPDGFVRFNVTDSVGATIMSFWQIVYPDKTLQVSSLSVASVASASSAYSLQAYISGLSTSAQAAMTRPGASQGGPTAAATAGPNSESSSTTSNVGPIVGGVIGGVAGLLAIAVFAFWWVRRSYPQNGPPNSADDATTTAYGGGWGPNAADKEPSMAQTHTSMPYNPYQSQYSPPIIAPTPTTPVQIPHPQSQPPHGIYGGLPEIQGGHR